MGILLTTACAPPTPAQEASEALAGLAECMRANRATFISSAAGSTDASEFMAGACGDWTSDESLSPEARELIENRSKEVVGEAFKQLLAAAFASAFSDDGSELDESVAEGVVDAIIAGLDQAGVDVAAGE